MEVRNKLLQAALRVFEECGSRGATTRRIAAEAGVNEITLFRHFGNKAALLNEAISSSGVLRPAAPLPREPRNPRAELLAWARAQHAGIRHNAALIRTSMGEMEGNPEMLRCSAENPRRANTELQAYLERLQGAGLMRAGVDTYAATAMLTGSLFADAMGRDMIPERYPYPEAEAPGKYVELFLRAIGADPDPAPPAAGTAPD
ncbi:MAG TPA: helix-turn-helix domain-containing protein [Longimicrobium sp.]|jgi:AcrR family transcriptional regulator|uniref:TetR/AcrR family transcriptional regulator n=1 Tax=Longimicrobium sp. TaxID=2029185 RepID=UPI002ED83DA1